MAKVVISGYYGFDNTGDEAILAGIISALRKLNPQLSLVVLSAEPEVTAERYDLKAVARTDFFAIYREIKQTDLFISGGGSLLQDVTGPFSVPYYLGLIWLARFLGKKVVFYAQGVGPLKRKFSQILTALTLKNITLLGVRDNKSKELLKEIGIPGDNIIKTVDPVFNLADYLQPMADLVQPAVESNVVEPNKDRKKLVCGIAVRPWQVEYLAELAAGLNAFQKETACSYVLLAMHQGEDELISRKLAAYLQGEYQLQEFTGDPLKVLSSFQKFDIFLGVRLHSLIFAKLAGLPFAGLSYDPKIDSFFADLGLAKPPQLEDVSQDLIYNLLDNLRAEWLSGKETNQLPIAYQKEANSFAKTVLEVADLCGS